MKHGRWLVIVAVVGLLAGACSRSSSSTAVTSPGGGVTTTSAAAAAGPGDFASLKAVCGPGNAKGATDKGVTDTTIDIGTLGDPGTSISPGLLVELFDTSTAFVKWCNAAGGILGRQINLHLRDAALFNLPARIIDACGQDFAEVGGGNALDDTGVAQRLACQLPQIPGYANTPKAANAGFQVQATPYPTQEVPVAQFLGFKRMFPGELKAGFLTGNTPSVLVTRDRYKEGAQDSGFTTVYDETYPVLGFTGAESYVQRMKAAGVQMLMVNTDDTAQVVLLKAMQTVGWYPDAIIGSANQYSQTIIKNAGSAVKNLWVTVGLAPFEDASQSPAVKQYLDIMHQYNPSGRVATLGLNSMNAWLLFATAATACGSNLTRACLLQQGGSHPDWTGGGLQGPVNTNFANRHAQQCYVSVKGSPTGFTVDTAFLPLNQGLFNCDPANVVTLKGNYSS